jgi:hypothetical protein
MNNEVLRNLKFNYIYVVAPTQIKASLSELGRPESSISTQLTASTWTPREKLQAQLTCTSRNINRTKYKVN